VLPALPFVARHGNEWVSELLDQLGPIATGHLIVRLPSTSKPEETSP
jgi:hypothetical protein